MFEYFISLGPSCFIASSMGKYGLRSFSAPFDWLITSDFNWVLHYIETDFKDFLLKENLETYNENFYNFREKNSGFIFLHEPENFELNYEKIRDRYNRRIKRFLEKTKSKVCYLRYMRSQEDFEYIVQNAEYIIKKYNPDSEIVFLCGNDIVNGRDFPFRYYNNITNKYNSSWSKKALRSYFDRSDDFLTFCGENYLNSNLIKNLRFDVEKNEISEYECRYKRLTALLSHDFNNDMYISDKIIIYGASDIGKELYKKIKNIIETVYFIDQYTEEKTFDNVPIIKFDKAKPVKGAKVIVTALGDFQNVKGLLLSKFAAEDIISLDNILNLKF